MPAVKKSYTESLGELDDILEKLENNDMPLEELLPLVKRASSLVQRCKQQLFDIDSEIQKVIDDLD